MSPSIMLVGSINMDLMLRCPHLPQPGETVLGGDFRTAPGGKGANQAVAAARLGGRVALVACVGDDAFGTAALTGLRAKGVDLRHVLTLPRTATGVAMVQVDDAGQNCIALAPGANACLTAAQVEAAAAAIQQAGLLVCQLETPLPAVECAIALAHAAGVPVLLNPAPAVRLPDSLLSQVDLLVLNEGEAAVVSGLPVGGADDAARAAGHLVRAGVGTVLVTLGADGVVWAGRDGSGRRAAKQVVAVDTTGAGDTFIGALAVAWVQGQALEAAVDFAQSAAAFSVQRHGAQAAMPRRSDLV